MVSVKSNMWHVVQYYQINGKQYYYGMYNAKWEPFQSNNTFHYGCFLPY